MQAAEDPFAKLDSFEGLNAREKDYWAKESTGTLEEKLQLLKAPLEATTSVEVKLVGFSADGYVNIPNNNNNNNNNKHAYEGTTE
jgi:hypothetical protein